MLKGVFPLILFIVLGVLVILTGSTGISEKPAPALDLAEWGVVYR